jgi:hypothetical protein
MEPVPGETPSISRKPDPLFVLLDNCHVYKALKINWLLYETTTLPNTCLGHQFVFANYMPSIPPRTEDPGPHMTGRTASSLHTRLGYVTCRYVLYSEKEVQIPDGSFSEPWLRLRLVGDYTDFGDLFDAEFGLMAYQHVSHGRADR